MNILIPMAGEGSRFAKEGYMLPKPLIDVKGKSMIQTVVENLSFDSTYIFLVRKEHIKKYPDLKKFLIEITKGNAKIVEVDGLTEGAACTALLAKDLINNNEELLIANSDQYVVYNKSNFLTITNHCKSIDAVVFTFNSTHPKWSFVQVNKNGIATRVEEKNPISNIATCGIYWYRKGSMFVKYAEAMIKKNVRINNEFYIAPVYNELIEDGKKLVPFYVEKMQGLGTPEDLKEFLHSFI